MESNMAQLSMSVVVATYNRCDVLRTTLACLADQTLPASRYEVIVVDDGSPDDTGEMVREHIGKLPFRLTYLVHSNRGPGATQNRGIMAALGEIVLLIPDDVQPTRSMLESHLAFHQAHPEQCFAALGRVLQSEALSDTVFQHNWDPFKYWELDGATELPYWKFWACNISVKRDFLLQHGMFRELKGAAHEDVELGYRLSQAGLRILYHPAALAYHYHVETLSSASKRAYERGLNWKFINETVPDPQIHVKYHILNPGTFMHHIKTFRDLSKSSLPPEDRNLPVLLSKQLIRSIVFNRLTVGLWTRLLNAAEHNRAIAACMRPQMYRGVTSYYFLKGCRDGKRAPLVTKATPSVSSGS
jgi:glycosyltransferase involved in cell wall biosynthesis